MEERSGDPGPEVVLPPGVPMLMQHDMTPAWSLSVDGCKVESGSFSVARPASGVLSSPFLPENLPGRLPALAARRGTADRMPNIPSLGNLADAEDSPSQSGQQPREPSGTEPLQPYLVVNLWKVRPAAYFSLHLIRRRPCCVCTYLAAPETPGRRNCRCAGTTGARGVAETRRASFLFYPLVRHSLRLLAGAAHQTGAPIRYAVLLNPPRRSTGSKH
jgi:hypothetical protein